jgi:elongator complex protein 2
MDTRQGHLHTLSPSRTNHRQLIALAISHSKGIIATACKSTSLEHAVVRLIDAESFKPFGLPLKGHSLTVTRIAFNHDDRLILAVGKDRTWHLFERMVDESGCL